MRFVARITLFILISSAISCGGGGDSDSDLLIEGTLTEAGGAGHANALWKHGVGERIGEVEICALGECSTTDDQGQWGIVTDFGGGPVHFTIEGHGISSETTLEIPPGARDVFLDFRHVEGGTVKAEHITIDGETSHHEDEEHTHE